MKHVEEADFRSALQQKSDGRGLDPRHQDLTAGPNESALDLAIQGTVPIYRPTLAAPAASGLMNRACGPRGLA